MILKYFWPFVFGMVTLVSVASAAGKTGGPTNPSIKNKDRHDGFLEDIKSMKGNIDLVFVGDSITDAWRRKEGKAVWDKHFAPLNALNLGIGGDRTQHVLWRMQNGELEGYKAKLFVVMIGTNNSSANPPDAIAQGVEAILKEIRTRQPQAKILLLAIFPRANKKTGQFDSNYQVNEKTNAIIEKLADGKTIIFKNINDKFLNADKKLPKDIMPDYLHPNPKGYQIWADAIISDVKSLLSSK